MIQLVFAQIDAKDDIYCGYHTVGIRYNDGERGPRSLANTKVLAQAEGEYLKRLHELQVELKKKYEPLLKSEPEAPAEYWEDEADWWAFIREYRHLRYT